MGISKVLLATKQGIIGIIVDSAHIVNKYLKFWFQVNVWLLERYSQGSSIKEVRVPILGGLDINVPSLNEQRKAVHFLKSLDNLINLKQRQIALAVEWKKGLMQGLFV